MKHSPVRLQGPIIRTPSTTRAVTTIHYARLNYKGAQIESSENPVERNSADFSLLLEVVSFIIRPGVVMKPAVRLECLLPIVVLALSFSCGEKGVEPESPVLSLSNSSLDFGAEEIELSFTISNTGSGSLNWNISESLDWATTIPRTGATGIEIDTVFVVVDRPGLSADTLSGQIAVFSNGGAAYVEVVARDTSFAAAGIYAELVLNRRLIRHGQMGLMRMDFITARFDSSFTPCVAGIPLQVDSVRCNEFSLEWDDSLENYSYSQSMPSSFLELGVNYTFDVYGNDYVPSLVDSIAFPLYEPNISEPADGDTISGSSDLNIVWENHGGGSVFISLVQAADSACVLPGNPYDIEGIFAEAENNGAYSISAADLGQLDPGDYVVILNSHNTHYIDIEGYDPRSFIIGKTASRIELHLE